MPEIVGYEFYRKIGSPKFILAPMVDQSELAWRLFSRKHGAQLAYTPMFHAANFVRDSSYRREAMENSPLDRPLIYQFCSNDPDIFAEAAKLAQGHCDAVDLNLGCPQMIAKRGHYGSYLQDEWDLIAQMLKKCIKEISIPVTAKIRAQSTIELTVKYAKMIESCGVSLLTIHGRTRDQKGVNTGLADWAVIKAVKEALSIPVIANGNILYYSDIERCIEATGADGVMSAEGQLHNPGIFMPDELKFVWRMALEYLTYAKDHPCNISYSRGHVFKLLHHSLHCHPHIREFISRAKDVDDLIASVSELEKVCGPSKCQADEENLLELPYKHWLCQPYIRPAFQDLYHAEISPLIKEKFSYEIPTLCWNILTQGQSTVDSFEPWMSPIQPRVVLLHQIQNSVIDTVQIKLYYSDIRDWFGNLRTPFAATKPNFIVPRPPWMNYQ